jgi:rhamnosyltransferase
MDVSVIIRAKDSAATLERAIASVRAQTVPSQLVIVDSGSTDGTREIARRQADELVEISAESYTPGVSLNAGAARATGAIHVALSSHCVMPADDWLATAVAHFSDPRVASACGIRPAGPIRAFGHGELPSTEFMVGLSNHAGAWRAERWREYPFREDLLACEDKDWDHHMRAAGHLWIEDPALFIAPTHRWRQGIRAYWRRCMLEGRAVALITGREPPSAGEVVRAWWRDIDPDRSHSRQRMSPSRSIGLAATARGERLASRSHADNP